MLREGGQIGGHGGVDQRQVVLVLEQRNGAVLYMPALDLGLARHPEHGGRKHPRREAEHRIGNALHQIDRAAQE